MNQLCVMFLLFLSLNAYSYDFDQIYNNETVLNLKNKITSSEESKLFEQGIKELATSLDKKIKSSNNAVLNDIYGDKVKILNACFYRFWKVDGVNVSKAVKEFIINTQQKRSLSLKMDSNFTENIYSYADKFSKQDCLSLINK